MSSLPETGEQSDVRVYLDNNEALILLDLSGLPLHKRGYRTDGGVAKTVLEDFKKKSGALICRDLKGIDTGKVLCACPDCVKHAVETLEKFE